MECEWVNHNQNTVDPNQDRLKLCITICTQLFLLHKNFRVLYKVYGLIKSVDCYFLDNLRRYNQRLIKLD